MAFLFPQNRNIVNNFYVNDVTNNKKCITFATNTVKYFTNGTHN